MRSCVRKWDRKEQRTKDLSTPKLIDKKDEKETVGQTKIVYELQIHKKSFNEVIKIELMRKITENPHTTIRDCNIAKMMCSGKNYNGKNAPSLLIFFHAY